LLHPFGDSNKSIETGVQSSLQPVYAMSTAGNRFISRQLLAPLIEQNATKSRRLAVT
jgi:hypothetical protein